MEDIYDDLDNYNNVNAVEELRHENMELKVKLEEHATAMEKLQKDYDTLEMEFKKLENNYSSLLKTARAEIERKTQRISQLNMEKDAMVLNSLKNGKRVRRNFKNVQNTTKTNSENSAKGKDMKNVKTKKDMGGAKENGNANIERCEPTTVQTKDVVTSSGSDSRSNSHNILENIVPRTEISNNRKSNIMQHFETEHIDTTKASSIKNRRKSMPAVSMQLEKFSSDEDFEPSYPHKDARVDIPPDDSFKRRNISKISYDRHNILTSETSSIEDRGSNYQESLRGNNRNKTSRNFENNPYRGKDKYEVSLRYKKHNSPERGQRRGQHREYQDDYRRQDHSRHRQRENSPPQETYNRHQRKQVDSRSNYNRYSHDYANNKHRYDEKQATKHRHPNDYDEPRSKKRKTESFGNQDPYYKEEKRYYNDKESMDIHSIAEYSAHEYDMLRISCQSPDYVYNETACAYPIKEIMATAAIPLDDPRVTSKKYVVKKENGKETLSVAEGRNIDIIPVDKVKWGYKSVPIPNALVQRPSQSSDEIVQDIYRDIDNPPADLSLESGEVRCETDDERIDRNQIHNECVNLNQESVINKKPITDIKQPSLNADQANTLNPKMSTYRIPKIGKTKTQKIMDAHVMDVDKHSVYNEKVPVEVECSKKTKTYSKMDVPTIDEIGVNEMVPAEIHSSKKAKPHNKLDFPIIATVTDKTPAKVHSLKNTKTHDKLDGSIMEKHNVNEAVSTEDNSSKKEKTLNKLDVPIIVTNNVIETAPAQDHSSKKTKVHDKLDDPFIGKNNIHKKTHAEDESSKKTKTDQRKNDEPNEKLSKNASNVRHQSDRQHQIRLSNIAIVADDLELSDDNSDNVDSHKNVVAEKKASKVQSGIKEIRTEDPSSSKKYDSRNEYAGDNKAQTVIELESKTVEVAEKTKESASAKKQKNKKKKSKSKELSPKEVDTTDALQTAEKKKISKKEKEDNIGKDPKPKELNNKLSDLFGDSTSLMTPEDLGIPSYLPMSEDAQDAVDMEINQIIDAPPTKEVSKIVDIIAPTVDDLKNTKKNDESSVIITNMTQKPRTTDRDIKDIKKKKVPLKQDTSTKETIDASSPEAVSKIEDTAALTIDDLKTNKKNDDPSIIITNMTQKHTTDADIKDIKKKKLPLKEDTSTKEISPKVVYKNVNTETNSNESDVVKTVIISEGIQPQFISENNTQTVLQNPIADTELNVKENVTDYNQIPSIIDLKKQDIIKALATSTPLKEFAALKPLETNSRTTDTCDTNVSKTVVNGDNTSQAILVQSNTNTLDSNDAPDVRIFVKRRRKIMKRPLMT